MPRSKRADRRLGVFMLSGLVKTSAFLAFAAMLAGTYLSNPDNSKAALRATDGLLSGAEAPTSGLQRAAATPVEAPRPSLGYGREELKPDAAGQYQTTVEFEGTTIPMLVDTGATLISLTYDDAAKIGHAPAPADFTLPVQTANGMAKAASLTLREVRLGTLMVTNVSALVPRDIKGESLLGMSFLKKLGGFEVASGNLVLRQ